VLTTLSSGDSTPKIGVGFIPVLAADVRGKGYTKFQYWFGAHTKRRPEVFSKEEA